MSALAGRTSDVRPHGRRPTVAAAALTVALLASLASAPAHAGHVEAEAQFVIVTTQVAQIRQSADLTGLTVDYNVTAATTPPIPGAEDAPTCEETQVTVDPEQGVFTFEETATGDGCADVRLQVLVPVGAQRVVVRFNATRLVDGSETLNSGSSLLQQFRIIRPDGSLGFSKDYFDDTEGSHPEPEPFTFGESLGPGVANFTLSWLFDDEGFQGEGLSSLQDFDASVGNITFEWPDVMLPPALVTPGAERELDKDHAATTVGVLVPVHPSHVGPRLTTSIALAVRHGPTFLGVAGPNEPVDPDALTQSDAGGLLRVELAATAVDRQGAGNYSFNYEAMRNLPPAATSTSTPATIAPLFYTLAFLPLAGAVLAIVGAIAFRREAEGRYLRGARILLVLVSLLVLYYVFVVVYAFVNVGRVRMWTLPLESVANLLYVQFVVVLLVFILVALGVSRYGLASMRRSLDERRAQQERLRQSNEELERFAYVASHDLQEPLRKVAGFTALLQKRYKGRLDKDADEMIDYAVDGATRMQALIRDILAYSRVNSTQLEFQVVDLGALMDLVVNDLDGIIRKNRASVTWKGLPTVRADPTQIRQVLQNLVENGLKYRHPKRKPRITVSAERHGAGWAIRVTDNGMGIPVDKQEEVFGIFRRLHGRDVPGTGIGLAIVRKAVERHGGTVQVESAPSGGSVFMFTLPHG